MPYIITTKRRWNDAGSNTGGTILVSRHAVATLDVATLARACRRAQPAMILGVEYVSQMEAAVKAHGGTIGPLPDGTVIEVAPAAWADLVEVLNRLGRVGTAHGSEIIDAYNAAQG
jgi:hypothetical protein